MSNAARQRLNVITSVRHKEMRSAGVTSTKLKVQPVGFSREVADCSPSILLLALELAWLVDESSFQLSLVGLIVSIPTWMSCLFVLNNVSLSSIKYTNAFHGVCI